MKGKGEKTLAAKIQETLQKSEQLSEIPPVFERALFGLREVIVHNRLIKECPECAEDYRKYKNTDNRP